MLTVKVDKKNRLNGEISNAEKNKPNTIATVTWRFMTK
jgi:alpha-D-xyloside xylohydrolase